MPIQFHRQTLDNGLNVLAETNPDAHTAAVGFFVQTGSRDEPHQLMGVSHFLEHMMFKGTDRRTADDVNREFDEIGANYNAFTSQEMTVYFAQVLPEFLGRAVDLLGDMMRPSLREDDFKMEKNVILEEIGMYDDRPQWRLHDTMLEKHFDGHPLSYRVLGTRESIEALGVDQMREYFQRRYSPDNITLVGAGRLDFEQFVSEAKRLTGNWQPSGTRREYTDPSIEGGDHTTRDEKLNRHYLAMICPAPSAQDEQRYAAQVLADVVGDADGSRLYWALVDPGLADEADISFYPQDQVGSYVGYASCGPARAGQVEQTFMKTLDELRDSLREDEVERAKNKIATQATLRGEIPLGRMRAVGGQWAYLREYSPLEDEIQKIMAVSLADVRSLLDAYSFQPRTVVRFGPQV